MLYMIESTTKVPTPIIPTSKAKIINEVVNSYSKIKSPIKSKLTNTTIETLTLKEASRNGRALYGSPLLYMLYTIHCDKKNKSKINE